MDLRIKDFIMSLQNNYTNVIKMNIFNYFKTGEPIVDTILSTIGISIFGLLINYIADKNIYNFLFNLSLNNIKSWFFTKRCVIIEGRRSSSTSSYSSAHNVSSVYSIRFKAMWQYIINNIDNNNTIYQIRESHSNYQSSECKNSKNKTNDMFMVSQNKDFKLDDNIYVNATLEQEGTKDDKDKITTTIDKITIKIYSYKYSLSYLKKYIETISDQYLTSLKNSRNNKRFVYFLDNVKIQDEDDKYSCWREYIFESSRTFKNIFFDGKKDLISKIEFFINNREWYYTKGIPYTLGIGLHGPPGTGKTSLIKVLANFTDRNIIVISLKIIKTKRQLEQFFFENTYNDKNEQGDMSFDKKIIVFEDIDCIGDIVLNRNSKNKEKDGIRSSKKNDRTEKDNLQIGDILQSICDFTEPNNTSGSGSMNIKSIHLSEDPPITLDDILNLWDGIRETPGRILIISSNHYDKLDPALIRPGRIDITHELSNASYNTISEIYFHLFEKKIDKKNLEKVREYFYSPAELINMYISNNKNEEKFIARLVLNKKI